MPTDPPSALTEHDMYLWAEGNHARAYEKLGAHPETRGGKPGTRFAVWAPNADEVSVTGEFNEWKPGAHPLRPVASSGVWEGFVAGVGPGDAVQVRHPQPADRLPRPEEPTRSGSRPSCARAPRRRSST